MTEPDVLVSHGITLTFATSSWAPQLLDINLPGGTRGDVDLSHQATTGAKVFQPESLYDAGELSISGHHKMTPLPPISGAAETIYVRQTGATFWTFSGYLKDYKVRGPHLGKMMFDGVIKIAGAITTTTATA